MCLLCGCRPPMELTVRAKRSKTKAPWKPWRKGVKVRFGKAPKGGLKTAEPKALIKKNLRAFVKGGKLPKPKW